MGVVNMENTEDYFLGLDIGTNSVGYAVTDNRYRVLKYKGEPMWGSHLFDEALQCAERRGYRTARRRLDRRQQRVHLVDEIFAPYVTEIDKDFYVRKQSSELYGSDKKTSDPYLYFNDTGFNDSDYHNEYKTIHHLIMDLINDKDSKFDLRLINIAIDWLVAHRGHFLRDINVNNVDSFKEIDSIYKDLKEFFESENHDMPWDDIDAHELGDILKYKGVNNKKQALKSLLYPNGIQKDDYFIDRSTLISFLAGGKVKPSALFADFLSENDESFSISDEIETILPKVGDYADLICKFISLYEWSVLSDLLGEYSYISESKVAQYEKHKKDLRILKKFVSKYYDNETYNEIFRYAKKDLSNYTAYSKNYKSVKTDSKEWNNKNVTKYDFCDYLKKKLTLDKVDVSEEDESTKEYLIDGITNYTFMPKQVNGDNRVIPYQLYYKELIIILDNAAKHYSFLNEKDNNGYINIDKLKSIFTFKIPYYVGPLYSGTDKNKGKYSWMIRKDDSSSKIYPWDFNEKVDLDKSEEAFISRMTNTCTYLPGETVLPKYSLLYSKFTVLNEINNIKSNDVPISVDAKQGIYNDLFCKCSKVSRKKIEEYLLDKGYINKDDVVSGIDININSNLKSRNDFNKLINTNKLSESEVESIIARRTYSEDKARYVKWIKDNYSILDEADIKYIGNLKYKDFGRLSRKLLTEIKGADNETGESGSIIDFLWNTNDNFMQIIESDRYTFKEVIYNYQLDYYYKNPRTINEQLEEMGISNAVKRPVIRTLSIVDEVVSAMKTPPKKIFVEMARGAEESKRSKSRYDQLMDLYKTVKDEDIPKLKSQLEQMGEFANNKLQSEAVFLYFLQLGKSMYSDEPIDITKLASDKYNIDHIYPQSYVKDDSILNNKVLVLSEENGDKGDVYPIKSEIREKMKPFWDKLLANNLITKEKYQRLIRKTRFSDEEKQGFINRQLVETRQSMKAVTRLLNTLYPESKIVYVKAKLVADFKQEFDFTPKSRLINDLHHAKDAYLNVVAGNVYYERFTSKWFSINDKYSLKTQNIFKHPIIHGDETIWDINKDLPVVKKTYDKNNIHLTRYSYCQNGALFKQNPLKKHQGQLQLKNGYDIDKYGGYDKITASFFVLVKYKKGGKDEVSFIPVDLIVKNKFLYDDSFRYNYVYSFLNKINNKEIKDITFPLKNRIIKYKSLISLDGYKCWITSKGNNGTRLYLSNAESCIYPVDFITYIKKIENYYNKNKTGNIIHDEKYDGLSSKSNTQLFDYFLDKLNNNKYKKMPGNIYQTINNREKFINLEFNDQISVLIKCIDILYTGRSVGLKFKELGINKEIGALYMSSNISNSKYEEIILIDESASGIYRDKSINLKDLLK